MNDARRSVGKWLNETPDQPVNKSDIAELCAAFDRQEVEIERLLERIADIVSNMRVDLIKSGGHENGLVCIPAYAIREYIAKLGDVLRKLKS